MTTALSIAVLATTLASAAQLPPASQAPSQPSAEAMPAADRRPLTNNQVISLAKGGLSDEALIEMIQESEPHFNVSSVGIALLAQTGVSRRVIREMQIATEADSGRQAPRDAPPPGDAPAKPQGVCVFIWCW